MKSKLEALLTQLVENQEKQIKQLDKLAALLTADQLMTECVDHEGRPRSAEACAEIVVESFSAGLCLMGELDQRNREYQYQKQEFFIDDEDEDSGENDDTNGPSLSATSF